MIAKMKKYTFLIFHKEYETFLETLRELGVLHVELKEEGTPDNPELFENIQLNKTLKEIKKALLRRIVKDDVVASGTYKSGFELMDFYQQLIAEIETLQQALQRVEKDIQINKPWGEFSFETLEKLKENGNTVNFFSCPASKYQSEWEADGTVFKISTQGSTINFVQVLQPGSNIEIDADPVRLAKKSLSGLFAEKKTLSEDISEKNLALDGLAKSSIELIQQAIDQTTEKVDFATVVLGSEKQAEEKLAVLEGWIPVSDEAALVEMLKSSSVYYEDRKPTIYENVPVLLKNNAFAKLFEVISDLYSKPKYSEIDLTPFLAPFYLIFFGFCFSDAGYGLLFVFAATFFKMKAEKESKGMLTLVQLLGASTVFFGLLGGVFFGIELYNTNLPFYSSIAEAYGSAERPITGIIQDIMFKASLGLGLFQMLFGMFLKAAKLTKQAGFKYAISTLGWAFLIIASVVNYFAIASTGTAFTNVPYLVVAGICLFGIFFMNSPGKNPFVNFGAGLWDTYNTVVGGVGDLLSYVRLFALGLASGILGLVFNQLGSKMFNPGDPEATIGGLIGGFIGMLVVLIAGHAINIFMSGLGSMVHPLRLTFVEFYKNAGFEGGGLPYNPFRKQIK